MKSSQRGKFVVAVTMALFVMALGTGAALAASFPEDVELRATIEFDLMPTEMFPDATGDFRGEVRADDGELNLRARAKADGLVDDHSFSLCVNGHFLGSDMAAGGRVDFDVDMLIDSLPSHTGLMVAIKMGIGCDGESVLHRMVP